YISYLDAYLTGPDGQRIELFTEVGGEGDHFDETILDDQGRYPIVKARPPFKGTFLPEALIKKQPSLSHFNGKSVKGVWQLVVRCTRSERFGMLHNWGLIVRPEEGMLGSTMAVPSQEDSESSAVPAPGESARPASDEKSDSKLKLFGAQIIKRGDKNGDGVLTIDEYAEKDRQRFGSTDTNNDGRVDASELGAAMKRLQGAKPE
nr:proprotein convertase P-domain-containing protein [Planctomycetota bacterium]